MDLVSQITQNPPQGLNGLDVDVDKAYGAQCWDLCEYYAEMAAVPKEPWALPLGPNGWAVEAWTYFTQIPHMQKYFTQIPAAQRQRGDINIYGPHGTYVEGHCAIELGGGQVFEQNADPDGAPCHASARATTYLLGSLRFKGDSMSTIADRALVNTLARAFLDDSIEQNPGLAGYIGEPVEAVIAAFNTGTERDNYITGLADTLNIANLRGDRLTQIAAAVGADSGDDQPAIMDKINSLKSSTAKPTILKPGVYQVQ